MAPGWAGMYLFANGDAGLVACAGGAVVVGGTVVCVGAGAVLPVVVLLGCDSSTAALIGLSVKVGTPAIASLFGGATISMMRGG